MPFWKDPATRAAIRPILCAEAPLKFAMCVLVLGSGVQLAEAVGPDQYGAGRQGGAELEVAEVRAAAAAHPDDPLLALDLKNAFGTVSWILALEAVVASAPRLAPALAAQWASGHMVIFARRAADAGWTAYAVTGGFFQGNVEAHPVFCIVFYGLTVHVARVTRALSTLSMRFWRYVDDWVIQVHLDGALLFWEAVVDAAPLWGMELQPRKCTFHIPAHAGQPLAALPAAARLIAERI